MKYGLVLSCVMAGQAFAGGWVPSTMPSAVASVTNSTDMQVQRPIDPQYPFGRFSEKMSYKVFAALIKYQFPGHDGMDSLSLAKRAVAAYPVYASVVDFPAGQ